MKTHFFTVHVHVAHVMYQYERIDIDTFNIYTKGVGFLQKNARGVTKNLEYRKVISLIATLLDLCVSSCTKI